MTESEQKYGDFRKSFRESTTVSLKKLEIQNGILQKEVEILGNKVYIYKTLSISLGISILASIAAFAFLIIIN